MNQLHPYTWEWCHSDFAFFFLGTQVEEGIAKNDVQFSVGCWEVAVILWVCLQTEWRSMKSNLGIISTLTEPSLLTPITVPFYSSLSFWLCFDSAFCPLILRLLMPWFAAILMFISSILNSDCGILFSTHPVYSLHF